MTAYTWKYPASQDAIEDAKEQAVYYTSTATDGYQEMQVMLAALDALKSEWQERVEFGLEVIRIFERDL